MDEKIKDKILSSERFTKFNISYPVIVKGWDIVQDSATSQRYLNIDFQNISDSLLAFKINVVCLSAFDKELEIISDFTIKNVDKKKCNFTESILLSSETEKVSISLSQYVLSDATIGPTNCQNEIVEYQFNCFDNAENVVAGKRLLLNAKGYPIEKGSHWYCACGKINWKESQTCVACKCNKEKVFATITDALLNKEKTAVERENKRREEEALEHRKSRITLISIGSVLAVIAIIVCILCATLLPMPTVTVDGLKYKKKSDGTYALIKCNSDDENVEIPSEVRGVKVTSIGEYAFSQNKNLKSITIPEEVTRIGIGAFLSCTYLEKVDLQNTIEYIEHRAFENCINLTEIMIPSNIKLLGDNAFSNYTVVLCRATQYPISWSTNLIRTPSNIIWGYISRGETPDGLKWVLTNSDDVIIYNFVGDSHQSKITIPETINGQNVTKIWKKAFYYNFFTSVELPNTIIEIGDMAFYNSKDLTKINIPISVTNIGEDVFKYCDKITIYCEANSKPTQWDYWKWNRIDDSNYAPVVWGYTGE